VINTLQANRYVKKCFLYPKCAKTHLWASVNQQISRVYTKGHLLKGGREEKEREGEEGQRQAIVRKKVVQLW
jgi:hypothetical protein